MKSLRLAAPLSVVSSVVLLVATFGALAARGAPEGTSEHRDPAEVEAEQRQKEDAQHPCYDDGVRVALTLDEAAARVAKPRRAPGFLARPRTTDERRLWCIYYRNVCPVGECGQLEELDLRRSSDERVGAARRRIRLALDLPATDSGLPAESIINDELERLDEWVPSARLRRDVMELKREIVSDGRLPHKFRVDRLGWILPWFDESDAVDRVLSHPHFPAIYAPMHEQPRSPVPLTPEQIAAIHDPLAPFGGLGSLRADEKKALIDLATELGDADHLREVFLRPEFVPEAELRAYAASRLEIVIHRPVCWTDMLRPDGGPDDTGPRADRRAICPKLRIPFTNGTDKVLGIITMEPRPPKE